VRTSTAGVVVIGRSLRVPLRDLEHHALAVADGTAALTVLDERGPRETRVVIRTVNDLVAHLGAVEQQVDALARADLDDPVLKRPASGSLGRSVQAAVERLGAVMGEQAVLRERLVHDASHDPLTGLLNRGAALDAVRSALGRAERAGTTAAVLFVDLDGFKQVNDLHGHALGDEVLRQVVDRVRAVSRAGDTVARLGGDEFLIVAEPVEGISEAVHIGERVVDVLRRPFELGEVQVVIGASVGVALGSRAADVETVVADADLAVYEAKAAGKGVVEVYHPDLRRELTERTAVEADLRTSLLDGTLELHYQPVVDAAGGRVRAVEALLRWDRPGVGVVAPSDFIPVAETSALIVELGRWVLERAIAQVAEWRRDPAFGDLRVAVNVSARHLLTRTFVDDVRDALELAALHPSALIIELTETALLADLPTAGVHLAQLRQLGVGVALDDFGTGHTSFAHLRHLPIDTIKIDRSYIAALDDPAEEALTRLMADVAGVLGVDVVAEGVEHPDQLDAISHFGCGQAQGFHICPPLPAAGTRAWLVARGSARGAATTGQ
jgi:diguanylate cyclase (GGDEF)-like protein